MINCALRINIRNEKVPSLAASKGNEMKHACFIILVRDFQSELLRGKLKALIEEWTRKQLCILALRSRCIAANSNPVLLRKGFPRVFQRRSLRWCLSFRIANVERRESASFNLRWFSPSCQCGVVPGLPFSLRYWKKWDFYTVLKIYYPYFSHGLSYLYLLPVYVHFNASAVCSLPYFGVLLMCLSYPYSGTHLKMRLLSTLIIIAIVDIVIIIVRMHTSLI